MEQELLQEIASYWGTRAEGYSEVNEKELAGSQREAWLHVLEEQFPEKKKEEMKILDIGTGPGFFPMILSEAGYTVAAVDYTEEMLEKAKENLGKYTKYGLERVTLQRMDAQNLEFADETFDVVISRNLTWNLEKPEQAYQEWMRVLKPGGVLLNFDANWYGYLYDEEKKEAYEADRKKVEEQQLDDHYLCTDIDRMENIARQVPLSAMERPAWDTKVLESLDVCSIQTDSEIWKRVWSEEERLNYASTPMFLVRAEKSAEQSFQLGDVTVRRGEKYQGMISFANGDIVLGRLSVENFREKKSSKGGTISGIACLAILALPVGAPLLLAILAVLACVLVCVAIALVCVLIFAICLLLVGGKLWIRGLFAITTSVSGFAMVSGCGLFVFGVGIFTCDIYDLSLQMVWLWVRKTGTLDF